MKKTYLKPDADYIKFYSDEEMTGTEQEGSMGVGGEGTVGPGYDGWE